MELRLCVFFKINRQVPNIFPRSSSHDLTYHRTKMKCLLRILQEEAIFLSLQLTSWIQADLCNCLQYLWWFYILSLSATHISMVKAWHWTRFCFFPAILMSSTYTDKNDPFSLLANKHSQFGTFSHPFSWRTFSNCLSHHSPAKGWPYRFRLRRTTGSSILDHDLGPFVFLWPVGMIAFTCVDMWTVKRWIVFKTAHLEPKMRAWKSVMVLKRTDTAVDLIRRERTINKCVHSEVVWCHADIGVSKYLDILIWWIFNNFGASSIFTWVQAETASAACPAHPGILDMISMTCAAVIWDADDPCSVNTACKPESSCTMSPRSTTRPFYFWNCGSNSEFLRWQRSIDDAKWTVWPFVLASAITSLLFFTFVSCHAGIVSKSSLSFSTAGFASGTFITSSTGINLCTRL